MMCHVPLVTSIVLNAAMSLLHIALSLSWAAGPLLMSAKVMMDNVNNPNSHAIRVREVMRALRDGAYSMLDRKAANIPTA